MNVDNDDEVRAEVLRMEVEERERVARESMAEVQSFTVNGQVVTATEYDWHQLLGQVADKFGWASQVMTWVDLERMISGSLGWSDEAYEAFPDAATRKAEFFDNGIRNLDCWQDANHVWTPVQMLGHVLARMGYFDSPQDMVVWIAQQIESDGSTVVGGVILGDDD